MVSGNYLLLPIYNTFLDGEQTNQNRHGVLANNSSACKMVVLIRKARPGVDVESDHMGDSDYHPQ